MPKPPDKEAQELFYLEDGQKADADLHNFILDQGDDEAARAVSARVAARILSPARLAKLNGEKTFDPSQPRDEEGKWTDGGGDGGGIGTTGADEYGESRERVTVGGRSYPIRDNQNHKIDSDRMRNAAVVNDDGSLSVWNVTDTPDRVVEGLANAGANLTESFGNEGDDLGAGFYGSAAPQIWMSRSASKWGFLSEMTADQRTKYVDYLRGEIEHQRETKYISATEYERAVRDLGYYAKGETDYITWTAEQPYNIASWQPDNLAKLGIEPGQQPALVKVNLRGRFVDLTDGGFRQSDLIELQKQGYDGAFVRGSFSYTPQFVMWKSGAIKKVEQQQHAE